MPTFTFSDLNSAYDLMLERRYEEELERLEALADAHRDVGDSPEDDACYGDCDDEVAA